MATEVWQAPSFNLAGIALFEDDFPYVPTGDYEVTLIETAPWKKKGTQEISSVIFRLRISEQGAENGKPVAKWVGMEVNEGNARGWKSAYVTFGYDPKALEGAITPHVSHFPAGKKGYIHMDSPPKAEGQKLKAEDFNVNFLSPETYRKRKAERALAGNGATAAGPQGFSPTGQAPGIPAAPATTAAAAPGAPAPVAPQPAATAGASLFGAPPAAPQQVPAAPAAPAGAPPPPPGLA